MPKIARFFTNVCASPSTVGWLVWGYFVAGFLFHPDSAIRRGAFFDGDDAMYLQHILDWLQGQSYDDVVQHRLNPPEGTYIHFSRLTEAPLALLIAACHAAGLDWPLAAVAAGAIWPPVLFALLLSVVRRLAACFVPAPWTGLTALLALFGSRLTMQFAPERVDHHGLACVLTALAFFCAVRLMQQPGRARWGFGAGLALALGQIVALETLVWLVLVSGWVALWMILKGREVARSGAAYGGALFGFSALGLAVTRSPASWFTVDALNFSIVYVYFALGIAAVCGALALAARWPLRQRWLAGGGATLIAGAAFLLQFPVLLHGPMGAMDPDLAQLLFDDTIEAQPLLKYLQGQWSAVLLCLALPLLALEATLICRVEDKRLENRGPWLLALLLQLVAVVLTIFFYQRAAHYAFLFALAPLTALIYHAQAQAAARLQGAQLTWARVALILLVGPGLGLALPVVLARHPLDRDVLWFAVPRLDPDEKACASYGVADVLNNPRGYGDHPRVILNSISEGAELVYRTRHQILAAPYHMDIAGNLNALRFFRATDPATAEKIARENHVDLVVFCPHYVNYVDLGPQANNVAARLMRGDVPAWLKPYPQRALLGYYRIYEVH